MLLKKPTICLHRVFVCVMFSAVAQKVKNTTAFLTTGLESTGFCEAVIVSHATLSRVYLCIKLDLSM